MMHVLCSLDGNLPLLLAYGHTPDSDVDSPVYVIYIVYSLSGIHRIVCACCPFIYVLTCNTNRPHSSNAY